MDLGGNLRQSALVTQEPTGSSSTPGARIGLVINHQFGSFPFIDYSGIWQKVYKLALPRIFLKFRAIDIWVFNHTSQNLESRARELSKTKRLKITHTSLESW